MLSQMLSLGGWIMFFLGVFLGTWVKSLLGMARSKVAG